MVFITLPDTEPLRTVQMIASLLTGAGWRVLRIEQRQGTSSAEIQEGIWIEVNGTVGPGPRQSPQLPAAEALRDVLIDSSISVNRSGLSPWLEQELPPNSIRIVVGLRPEHHFDFKKFRKEAEDERMRRMYDRPLGPQTPKPKP